jgi:hypothetical protein
VLLLHHSVLATCRGGVGSVEPAPKERVGGSTISRQQQEAKDEEMSVATSLAHLVQQDSVVSGVGVQVLKGGEVERADVPCVPGGVRGTEA